MIIIVMVTILFNPYSFMPTYYLHICFFNSVVDASLVLMNFMQAARAAGLVGCAISMLRNHPDRLQPNKETKP